MSLHAIDIDRDNTVHAVGYVLSRLELGGKASRGVYLKLLISTVLSGMVVLDRYSELRAIHLHQPTAGDGYNV